jgi:titin
LSWDAQASATAFRLEKSAGGLWPQVGQLIAAGSTSYIVPNITSNAAYTFRLIAVDAGGDSVPSATATATTKVPAPVITAGTFTDTAVSFTWPSITNATGYKIWRSTNPNSGFTQVGTAAVPVTPAATITGTDSTASQGSTYYYYVTATNTGGGDSLPSNILSATTLMTQPATPTAVSNEPTSIDLAWTAVPGATGYIIQVQGATPTAWTSATGSPVNGTVDTLNIGSLTAGTAYTYRIIAVDGAGNSLASSSVTTTTLLASPAATATATSTTAITLTWPSITHATSYIIQRSTDNVTWAQIAAPVAATTTSQTYADTAPALTPDTEYFYRIEAVDGGGDSAWSTVATTHTLLAAPSSVTATSISASEIDLVWTAQPTAAGFIVQVQGGTVAVPTWTQVGDQVGSGSTGVALTGLATKTSYTYRVIAVNDGGNSLPSSTASATTSTGVSKIGGTPLSSTSVALSWRAVTGATGYIVSWSTDDATWTPYSTLGSTTTNFTATGLTADTTYYFNVVATSAGANSAPSNVIARHTLLPAPSTFAIGVDATDSTTMLDLSWVEDTGETGYIVQRLLGTVWTNYATLAQGTDADILTGLVPNINYTFRVEAINTGGVSAPSNQASLATT